MRTLKSLAAGILTVLAVGIGTALPASASSTAPGSVGVAVSPSRVEVHLDASGHGTQQFTVSNPGSATVRISAFAQAYTEQSDGEMAPASGILPGSVTGTSWLTVVPSSFTLAPGASRVSVVRITEPKHAQPGQRTVAVLYSAQGKTPSGSGAAVQGAVAGEMIIDTPGILTHRASYLLSAPSISWGGAVPVRATVRNTGTAYVLDQHQYAVAGSTRVNLGDVLALAGATRVVTTTWRPGFGIDHISWQGQSRTTLVVPGAPVVITLAILVLVGTYWTFLKRTSRKRKHGRKPAPRPLAGTHGKH